MMNDKQPEAAPADEDRDFRNAMEIVADQMEAEIHKLAYVPPARPTMALQEGKVDAILRAKVRLRCESILHMAFQTWLQEVRGVAPMVGPLDKWKLHEIERILFTIDADNQDFG
jgi:hypothetical protein